MAVKSLAGSPQETNDRVERRRQLYAEHAAEIIESYRNRVWLVPSGSVEGRTYEVRLGRPNESCQCIDYGYHGHEERCKHIVTATLAHAKSVVCSNCGTRVLWRFATKVDADNYDGLCWFVGEVLCADCIRAGFWS